MDDFTTEMLHLDFKNRDPRKVASHLLVDFRLARIIFHGECLAFREFSILDKSKETANSVNGIVVLLLNSPDNCSNNIL